MLKSIVRVGLCVGDLYKVVNSFHHAHHIGGVFFDNGVMHFLEAERVECALLNCGAVDAALYLGDFDFCHCSEIAELTFEYLFYRDTAVLGYLSG